MGIETQENATVNEISSRVTVDGANGTRQGSMALSLTGTASAWRLNGTVMDGNSTVKASAGSTMMKAGDFFVGDIYGEDENGNRESIHTAFSKGFLPVPIPAGHDRFDMNISLGAGGEGIGNAAGDLAWYARRGPAPNRHWAGFGALVRGYCLTRDNRTKTPKFSFSGDLGVPYKVQSIGDSTVGRVTAFSTEVALDDADAFDVSKFVGSVARSAGVSADSVTVGSLKFRIKVEYSLPAAVTMSQAKTAIAKTAGVSEERVAVTILQGPSGRRLAATNVQASIQAPDTSSLKSLRYKVADTQTLKSKIAETGTVVSDVIVIAAPKEVVEVETQITSGGGMPAIEAPSDSALSQALSSDLDVSVETSSVVEPDVKTVTVTTTAATTPSAPMQDAPKATTTPFELSGTNPLQNRGVLVVILTTMIAAYCM